MKSAKDLTATGIFSPSQMIPIHLLLVRQLYDDTVRDACMSASAVCLIVFQLSDGCEQPDHFWQLGFTRRWIGWSLAGCGLPRCEPHHKLTQSVHTHACRHTHANMFSIVQIIGWRENPARRLLVYMSDAGLHFGADGKVGCMVLQL